MTAENPGERTTSGPLFGKGTLVALFAWGLIVLAFSVGGLADVTRFWWLVLLFGTAAPLALIATRGWASKRDAADGVRMAERELLGALREHGGLTPTAAAMLTSLTAAEAARNLERLAREGHLETRVGDEANVYALRERDRLAFSELPPKTANEDDPVEPLRGPLERAGTCGSGATGRRVHQQGDLPEALHRPGDRQGPRGWRLPQARCPLPRRGSLQGERPPPPRITRSSGPLSTRITLLARASRVFGRCS